MSNKCPNRDLHKKENNFADVDRCKLNYNCQCIQDLAEIFGNNSWQYQRCPILKANGLPTNLKRGN